MESNTTSNQNRSSCNKNEEEIDLIALAVRLWEKRRFIMKITASFMALGLLIGIISAPKFSSSCTIVPQSADSSLSGNLGSLAQLAGVSLGNVSGDIILPVVYENVMNNINLQKELINTPFYFDEYQKEITLLDYYTADEYRKFSIMDLPRMLLSAIRGEKEPIGYLESNVDPQLRYYTKEQADCVEILGKSIGISVEKDGYVVISASMPEAILSSQVVNRVRGLLQKYITEFKIEKALDNYTFVKELYDTAKVDFEGIQIKYAKFKDANKLLSSASAQIREETLKSEYDIASSTLKELTSQLISAEIKLKEDTPTFTVVEPAKVPIKKSSPKRAMLLIGFTILGGLLACGMVILLDMIKSDEKVNIKYLERW